MLLVVPLVLAVIVPSLFFHDNDAFPLHHGHARRRRRRLSTDPHLHVGGADSDADIHICRGSDIRHGHHPDNTANCCFHQMHFHAHSLLPSWIGSSSSV